jgi:LEA14-like dessication related protein
MTASSHARTVLLLAVASLLTACASLQQRDPLQVTVAGIEPMQGQGMELRMLVKLRVQNPNDAPIDYDGVSLKLDVQGKTFATGVSDESGSVPRFGESVIAVPVTTSAMRMVRQALGMMGDKGTGTGAPKINYSLTGKLNGPTFGAVRFESKGDLELPTVPPPAGSET